MSYTTILYEKQSSVLTITLNRPEKYNAVNRTLAQELQQAMQQAEQDSEVRVVVVTGAGKAFCSGHDLSAPENLEPEYTPSKAVYQNYFPLIPLMRNMPKPIICRLNGIAAGAGCSLALACDMIIADENAELSQIFINIGLVQDAGSAYFLPQLVSRNQAFELATMGTRLKAKEAERLGIVNKAVPTEQLDETLKKYTEYYANAPTKAIGMLKKLLNHSYHSNLMQMLELEATYQDLASKTQDHTEGVTAFLQKRKPVFKGR
ncbi:MAG: enoyl-CoA hydratase-related protein [Microscillaceae bacterium]|nr:enoyl-CoA hydratase-related protein [Microscillaceae bacterium]MDW8461666.1 enoyl-CoA hydratase-related protein [Cytophagales bacterium]